MDMYYIRTNILRRKFLVILFIPILLNYLSACAIHYKDISDDEFQPEKYSVSEKVMYKIITPPVFTSSADEAIDDVFKSDDAFGNLERYYGDDISDTGVFVLVETKYHAPDMPAIVFGYASIATLTLLPAWSNNDGFDVYFHIYVDGILKKTLYYKSRRFMAVWILLLPFIWVNLFTGSEYDAFTEITDNFIDDAQPYLSGLAN